MDATMKNVSLFHSPSAKSAGLKKNRTENATEDDVQEQDFVKKKKHKKERRIENATEDDVQEQDFVKKRKRKKEKRIENATEDDDVREQDFVKKKKHKKERRIENAIEDDVQEQDFVKKRKRKKEKRTENATEDDVQEQDFVKKKKCQKERRTENATEDDVQEQDFVKKRKRKKVKKKHENEESVENTEPSSDSQVLFEDGAVQSEEGHKKKKKKHKKEKEQYATDKYLVPLGSEISNETDEAAAQKVKKRKKQKQVSSVDEESSESCVMVNQNTFSTDQEMDAGYISLQPVKKKSKTKLPEEDEEQEVPVSDTHDESSNNRQKKKKKKKRRNTLNTQEDADASIVQSLLSSPEQNMEKRNEALPSPKEKVRLSMAQKHCEGGEGDVSYALSEDSVNVPANFSKWTKAADQSSQKGLLSSPERNREKRDEALPLRRKKRRVSMAQKQCEDGDGDVSHGLSEDSVDVLADVSKPTVAADHSSQKGLLSSPERNREGRDEALPLRRKKRRVSMAQKQCEGGDGNVSFGLREDSVDVPSNISKLTVAADQSSEKGLLSSPERNREKRNEVLSSPKEKVRLSMAQKQCEGGDGNVSFGLREDSVDVPSNISKLTVAADQSEKGLLSSPEKNRKRRDKALALRRKKCRVSASQKQRKGSDGDVSHGPTEESADVPAKVSKPTVAADQSSQKGLLSSPEKNRKRRNKALALHRKKRRVSVSQKQRKGGDGHVSHGLSEDSTDIPANVSKPTVAADQSCEKGLMSSPEWNREGRDEALPLRRKKCRVSTCQKQREGGDGDVSHGLSEGSADVPANVSELTVAADQSSQNELSSPERSRKRRDEALPSRRRKRRVSMSQKQREDGDGDVSHGPSEDSADVPANVSKATVAVDQSSQKGLLSSPEQNREKRDEALPLRRKKRRVSMSQKLCEDGEGDGDVSHGPSEDSTAVPAHVSEPTVAADQSSQKELLSSPEQNREGRDEALPSCGKTCSVSTSQKQREDGDGDVSHGLSEDSVDVPSNISKPTVAADQSSEKGLLSSPEWNREGRNEALPSRRRKRRVSVSQKQREDGDGDVSHGPSKDSADVPANVSKATVAADQSSEKGLLSSPERNREKRDEALPLRRKKRRVSMSQKLCEDSEGDGDVSHGPSEDSTAVPAHVSEPTVAADQSSQKGLLSSPEQNREGRDEALPSCGKTCSVSTSQKQREDGDGDVSHGLSEDSVDVPAKVSKPTKAADQPSQKGLSSPERNREQRDEALPSRRRKCRVSTSQKQSEDGDGDVSNGSSGDSANVPADVSKLTKAANQSSRKRAARVRKAVKSCTFITEDSSSDSDVMTPKTPSSGKKKDQNSSLTEMTPSEDSSLDDDDDDDSDCLGKSTRSVFDLDTARQELEEFIPHVKNIADSSIRMMAGRDLRRFKEFKKQGVAVKFGRFSQEENDQLRKNIEEFLVTTGIDSAEKLLFTLRFPEDKAAINRLKADNLFCEKLSEGIPRPWRLIYYRARKMFDPNNYKGRYTKEEKDKLKKYHALHGNDWMKISSMMSRSNLSVAMKYSEIKSPNNYGPWSKEEVRKLKHAVEEVIRNRVQMKNGNCLSSSKKSKEDLSVDREMLLEKLPWTEIEVKVGTRYWRQCKQKWITILTNKMTKGQKLYRGTKALQAKVNLIKRLYELKAKDADEVNWEELGNEIIGDVPKTYIQAKFYKLKVTSVPSWQKKTFSEIIDYLFEKKLPEFEERLGKKKEQGHTYDNSVAKEPKKTFLLSDIFDSSEESD